MSAELVTWKAWALDDNTWAFIFGWAWFFFWEFKAILNDNYLGTWTAHFRPIFNEILLLWLLGQAVLFWLWIHFFYPRVERWILEVVV